MRRALLRLFGLVLAGLAALVAVVPSRAVPEATADDWETNLRLLQRFRADPEQYARLRRDWHALMALPEDQRERLRRLDDDLHDLEPAAQARLWTVLERYRSWREHLSEDDRRTIDDAADTPARLAAIKDLKDREWIARLPRAVRDRVEATAEGPDRAALVVSLRKKEKDRKAEWQRALRLQGEAFPPRFQPTRLDQFGPDVQDYVTRSLLPNLSDDERRKLTAAEGSWPTYARTLVALSDRRPTPLPPTETPGVTTADKLPRDFRARLQKKMGDNAWRQLQRTEGRWPDYALGVVDAARARDVPLPEAPLGPATIEEYTPIVQEFVKQLQQDAEAGRALGRARGKWPEFPRAIMQLARERGARVPGTYLPGPMEFWNRTRVAFPDVPERTLRNFALTELTPEDWGRLRLKMDDPASRDRLAEEFQSRHPKGMRHKKQGDEGK